jgi:enediyne biosynthesis protein E4
MQIRMCLLACCAVLAQTASGQYFYDVGSSTGTQVECNTHGSGFFDYNNDGWDDIYVVHNTSMGGYVDLDNTLLKNLGNGYFSNATAEAGVQGGVRWSAQGLAAADYDNDGDIDMVIAMGSYNRPLFYKNNGNGTFSEAYLLMDANLTFAARCIAFIDYNNDGFVDILMLRNSTPDKPQNPMFVLYRNDRMGGFVEATRDADLWKYIPSALDLYGFAIADVNNDGFLDFYVPRVDVPSFLLINNGNGTFSELTEAYNLPRNGHQNGAIFLDYNNDGNWDLFVKRASPYTAELFRNNGNRTFTDVSHEAGVDIDLGPRTEDTVFGGGLVAADFDNDGYTDIFSINEFGWSNVYLRNGGDGSFSDATYASRLSESQYRWYWSTPVADYNHDGYPDIYMARSPGVPTYASLYRNAGGSCNWLKLKLEGACRSVPWAGSNRSGVGARVVAYMGTKKMTRQVQGGDSYKVNSFTVQFGMKWAGTVDSLKIYWPSGIVQTAVGIPANSVIPFAEKDTVQYFGDLFVAGTARHVRSDHKISQMAVAMTGSATRTLLTDVNGYYQFRPLNYGLPSVTITPSKPRGEDVDAGVMTSYDAALVLRYLTGLDTLSVRQQSAADVDQSGAVDAADAALIARYVVGIKSDARSKAGFWSFTPRNRTYTNLVTVYRYEDFRGTVTGDVSENWGNPGGSGKSAASAFCPNRIPLARGAQTLEIPVCVEAHSGLVSADVWMKFDPSCLEFLDASASSLTGGFNLVQNAVSGDFVKIALYGASPLTEAGPVLNLRFRVKNSSFRRTSVSWEKIAFNEQEFRIPETMVGAAENESAAPVSFGLGGNYPNPFNPGTTIEYACDGDGDVRLAVFDMQGRKTRDLVRGWRNPGDYKIEWDGKDDRGLDVPTGLYFCRLESGGRVSVIKMLKTR